MNPQPPVCLYHKNCLDGIASAWIVWMYFEGDVDLFAIQYGDPIPDNLAGRDVFVVDFSFDAETTLMLDAICHLTVLDHHKSAHEQYERMLTLPGGRNLRGHINIDQTKSGVGVVWDNFYGSKPMPEQLKMVQDHDLWKFDMPFTKNWAMGTTSYPANDIEAFDRIMRRPVLQIAEEGGALLRKHLMDVDKIAKGVRFINIDGVEFAAINANSHYRNELGDALGKKYPAVAVYFDGRDRRIFSLRSPKVGGVDTTKFSEAFGGGGHANASAFSIEFTDRRFRNSHVKLRSKGYYWRKLKSLIGF